MPQETLAEARRTPAVIIRITDRQKHDGATVESFLDARYQVVSHSGLNVAETQLIEALSLLREPRRLLVLGNRTGASAMIAGDLHAGAETVVHALDLHHLNAVRRNLSRNEAGAVTSRCEPYVTERDHFDAVLLHVSEGAMTGELVLDLLQQSHQALRKDGRCLVAVEGDGRWLEGRIRKLFGACSAHRTGKSSALLVAGKERSLKKLKNYQAEFTMTLPDGLAVRCATIPGVFAHRRVDQGAQALAEVAESQPGDAILDMGCGCGCIGISLAMKQAGSRACFVDSNSRATYVTERNCRTNGLQNYEVVLSDRGLDSEGRFTLFVGNPPYFSHHKIAELFITTAHTALQPEGRAYVVAKTAQWHYEFMNGLFGNAEMLRRRGYQIVKSVKRQCH